MINFHPVEYNVDITRDSPLFIGHFFDLTGMHWAKRKQRQAMVLSIAVGWYYSTRRHRKAPGFQEDEILITSLTSKISNAKDILTKFFTIKRIGYNFGNGMKSPTSVSPKRLTTKMVAAIEEVINHVVFSPGIEPTTKGYISSTVKIHARSFSKIKERLKVTNREDLLPAVAWLVKQDTLKFYYAPSGKLQQRDTSVWPVKSIETWPGWLRKELFGTVVDIENAYCQFLINNLYQKYEGVESKLDMLYPDILRADRDKVNFRAELCADVLKLPVTPDNISHVKHLIMALANGSRISTKMLGSGARSEAVSLVHQANPDLTSADLVVVGARLGKIARQFNAAKRDLCWFLLKEKPTKRNIKRIFHLYFEWERQQRYKIWDVIGKTGLMLHDGLDGVITDMDDEQLAYHIAVATSIRVSVDSLLEFETA